VNGLLRAILSPHAESLRREPVSGHCVYIARCSDGTLYTGYARDPVARLLAHNRGKGARYTAARRPITLEYTEVYRSRSAALRRECQIKRLSRAAKQQLILGTRQNN
jgi:putative endonuclease